MVVPYATFLEHRLRRQRVFKGLASTAIDVAPVHDPANAAPLPQQVTRMAAVVQGRPSPIEKC